MAMALCKQSRVDLSWSNCDADLTVDQTSVWIPQQNGSLIMTEESGYVSLFGEDSYVWTLSKTPCLAFCTRPRPHAVGSTAVCVCRPVACLRFTCGFWRCALLPLKNTPMSWLAFNWLLIRVLSNPRGLYTGQLMKWWWHCRIMTGSVENE